VQAFAHEPNHQSCSCDDLHRYLDGTGVTDADGVTHPGHAGWTVSTFGVEGVPTIDPLPSPPPRDGRVCVAARVNIEFSATSRVTKITWEPRPAPCNSGACQAEISAWQNRIDVHEQRHVEDDQKIATDANKRWPKRYRECATTQEEAMQQLVRAAEACGSGESA
jgi:hypothetical protein